MPGGESRPAGRRTRAREGGRSRRGAARQRGGPADATGGSRLRSSWRLTGLAALTWTRKPSANDGLSYVRIPAGSFQMGCSPDDSQCYDNEKPRHSVIDHPCLPYRRDRGDGGCVPALLRAGGMRRSRFRGGRLPSDGQCHLGRSRQILPVGRRAAADGSRMGICGARRSQYRAIRPFGRHCLAWAQRGPAIPRYRAVGTESAEL